MSESAAGLPVIGGVFGAFGAVQNARSQIKMARYNERIATENAMLFREKAKRDASYVKEMGLKHLGAMKASVGASGVTMDGSFLDVLHESARNVKRDELETIYQGELQARAAMQEAKMATLQRQAVKKALPFQMASSLLGGVSQGAMMSKYS